MMPKSKLPILFLLYFIFNSLSPTFAQSKKQLRKDYNQANKAFKKKNYSTGIVLGTRALQGALKNKQRIKLVASFRNGIINFHDGTLGNISTNKISIETKSSAEIQKVKLADEVVQDYSKLNDIMSKVIEVPGDILKELNFDQTILIDYSADLENAILTYDKIEIAFVEKQYELGENNLSLETKKSAYKAYYNFTNVIKYDREYEDAIVKLKESQEAATYTVSFAYVSNEITGMTTNQELTNECRNVFNNRFNSLFGSHNFFEIVDSSADFIISITLLDSEYRIDKADNKAEKKSEEIVIKEEKIKKENGEEEIIKVKETVEGTYTTYWQKAWLSLNGKISITNNMAEEKAQIVPITGYSSDEIFWYRFQGDKRVLDKYEKENIADPLPELKSKVSLLYLAARDIGVRGVDTALNELNKLF